MTNPVANVTSDAATARVHPRMIATKPAIQRLHSLIRLAYANVPLDFSLITLVLNVRNVMMHARCVKIQPIDA